MESVSFINMDDGTAEEYAFLEEIRLEVEASEVVEDHLAGLSPDARWALEQALPDGPDGAHGTLFTNHRPRRPASVIFS